MFPRWISSAHPLLRLRVSSALGLAAALACNPNTLRAPFGPLPQAVELELELPMAEAMQVIAGVLRLDSIPVSLERLRDGYIETGWFEARTGLPTAARPLGVEVVRVRGWATAGRVGHTDIKLEVVYRPMADPSRPSRDLERIVPAEHPVARRLEGSVRKLVEQFGDLDQLAPPPPEQLPARQTRPDTLVRPDTVGPSRGDVRGAPPRLTRYRF